MFKSTPGARLGPDNEHIQIYLNYKYTYENAEFCIDDFKILKVFNEIFHDFSPRNVKGTTTSHLPTSVWRFSWTKSICDASLIFKPIRHLYFSSSSREAYCQRPYSTVATQSFREGSDKLQFEKVVCNKFVKYVREAGAVRRIARYSFLSHVHMKFQYWDLQSNHIYNFPGFQFHK